MGLTVTVTVTLTLTSYVAPLAANDSAAATQPAPGALQLPEEALPPL